MADPTTTQNLLIVLGDGADPEVFAHPCGATARNVTFTNNTGEEVLLDCDDPLGVPAAVHRWVESQDSSLTISGRMAKESFATWRAFSDGGAVKNVRVELMNNVTEAGGYWEIPCILSSFEVGAEGKGEVTVSAELTGAGSRSWTDAS
jgi:hypothetical protein